MRTVEALAAKHAGLVNLRHLYIMEAHPADGWRLREDNDDHGVCVRQPRTLEARLAAARGFIEDGSMSVVDAARVLFDRIDNAAKLAFEARP